METEKTYQNKVARTIQQRQNGEGTLEMVDNCPVRILQAVVEPLQRVDDEDELMQGKFESVAQRQENEEDIL